MAGHRDEKYSKMTFDLQSNDDGQNSLEYVQQLKTHKIKIIRTR